MDMTVKKIGNLSVKVVSDEESKKEILTDSDIEMDKRAKAAVRAAIDKAKVCNKPIAKYDSETKRAYIEYPDGEIKYVE